MIYFFNCLKQYFRAHYNFKLYILYAIFLSVLITLNFSFDIEPFMHGNMKGSVLYPLFFFGINVIIYYTACLLQAYFTRQNSFFLNREFWIITLLVFVILSLDRSFYQARDICYIIPVGICKYVSEIIENLAGAVTIILPLYLIYKLHDHKHHNNLYGLTSSSIRWINYLMVIPILAIIICVGSFASGFQDFYPLYQTSGAEGFIQYFNIPEWVAVFLYELTYGFDFLRIELFYRGFLVIGMVRFLGKDTILPMVAVYVALHFGKPLEEAISSVFGGYIIGIISYYTKNLWGGVIWHVAIAWFMEAFAFLHIVMD